MTEVNHRRIVEEEAGGVFTYRVYLSTAAGSVGRLWFYCSGMA
jgi:hypothetical protein